jgi:hypothetical protein
LEGFDVKTHGFKFESYGNASRTNLTVIEIQRMFGDQVCATGVTGQDRVLTPPAENWMEALNGTMNSYRDRLQYPLSIPYGTLCGDASTVRRSDYGH